LEKISPNIGKSHQNSFQVKKYQNIYTKLTLKVQTTYIKPLMKPLTAYNKACFETAYLGENAKKLLKQKVAQSVASSLGYFIFSKSHNGHQKVARFGKSPNLILRLQSACPWKKLLCVLVMKSWWK
jgi:hypothetical protein